jgi:hypothetical protein
VFVSLSTASKAATSPQTAWADRLIVPDWGAADTAAAVRVLSRHAQLLEIATPKKNC